MSRSKQKGTAFETAVARYLSEETGLCIERRALGGSNDRGDLSGVFLGDMRAAVECKACSRWDVPEWLREAARERENDNADIGVVVAKRKGVGDARMGEQAVMMTLEDFAVLIGGLK